MILYMKLITIIIYLFFYNRQKIALLCPLHIPHQVSFLHIEW